MRALTDHVCLSVCLSYRNWVGTTLWPPSLPHLKISPPFVIQAAPLVSSAPL